MTTKCSLKHTKFQPTDDQWACPQCGARLPHFTIENSSNFDCELLHPDDEVLCEKCDVTYSGKEVATGISRKLSLVTCPMCRGTGHVGKGSTRSPS